MLATLMVLSAGIVLSPITVQGDATTTFETGDRLHFEGSSNTSDSESNLISIYRDAGFNDSFALAREEYNNRSFSLFGDTNTSIFVLRHTRGFDTVFFIDSMIKANAGSKFEETGYLYDSNPDNPFNDTWSHSEDLSGRMEHDGTVEISQPNATYAFMPEEFYYEDGSFNFTEDGDGDGFPFALPALQIDVEKLVTTGSKTMTINGASQTLTTRVFSMNATGMITANVSATLPLGPENDPNTPLINTIIHITIIVDARVVFEFDQATGIPVSVYRSDSLSMNGSLEALPQNVTFFDEFSQTDVTMRVSLNGTFDFENSFEQNLELVSASSHFRNTRPVSSGSPPIMENDVLNYSTFGGNSIDVVSIQEFKKETGDLTSEYFERKIHREEHVEGDTSFEVYRHFPDAFEAMLWRDTNVKVTETGQENYRDRNGNWNNQTFSHPTYDYDDFDAIPFFTLTNSSFEIAPMFEPGFELDLHPEDFMNFAPGAERFDFSFIPKQLPLVSIESPQSGTWTGVINGFDYTLPVVVYKAKYQMDIGSSQTDGDKKLDVTGFVEIFQAFIYDPATGALLEMNVEGEMKIDLVMTTIEPSDDHLAKAELHLTGMMSESNKLAHHPRQYQTPQPTNVSTTTSANQTATETTNTSPTLQNPLPGFELFGAVAMLVVVTVVKRRK